MTQIHSTCPYCGVGCGVVASHDEQGSIQISGDKTHPANFGRLCSKGSALAETLDLSDRLLQPEVHGQVSTWDHALDTIADGFKEIIDTHGADAIAFYVSGQLLTEDYYAVNKFCKGFLGTANIDTNSRLCMASSVAGHKRAFGSDTVAGNYEDLEQAELVVLVGSNLAWCHPVLFQRLSAAKAENDNLKVVVIDPRRTATADLADLYLPVQAGTDVWLFNGLLHFLRTHDRLNYEFLDEHTHGLGAALKTARDTAGSIPLVAQVCGLEEHAVASFYNMFARTEKTVTVYSQGVNQSSAGTDKVNSIINCHLATGRIGKVGMGPFSVTGQPNAMGGREVGALANQLAAHMDFKPEYLDLVQDFWQSPTIAPKAGLTAVDLFHAAAEGKIKAIWVMATNPVVSMPEADLVKQALGRCELVIVSDCARNTDTTEMAHVLLPALAWGEKDGTVTNSERRISRQRAFLPAPGEAKPDWWSVAQVAKRMGFGDAFAYEHHAEIFREHAALSAYQNNGSRDFDLSALTTLTAEEYQYLQPIQWPVTADCPNGTERLFGNGQFFTPDRQAKLLPVEPRAPKHLPTAEYPLILNSGRIRDQWHTMTRTGKVPRLQTHLSEPFLEMHPDDAEPLAIADGDIVEVTSPLGRMCVKAKLSKRQRRGSVFAPMHWNRQNSAAGKVGTLIAGEVDPVSNQPEFKHTPVAVRRYQPKWQGVLLTREPLPLQQVGDAEQAPLTEMRYWAKVRHADCWRYEFAGDSVVDWRRWAREHFALPDWLEFQDRSQGRYRCASVEDNVLQVCLFVETQAKLPARKALAAYFEKELAPADRLGILSGGSAQAGACDDTTVCACFGVSRSTIVEAIQSQNLSSVAAVTQAVKAGGGCGSCIPELKALLKQGKAAVA